MNSSYPEWDASYILFSCQGLVRCVVYLGPQLAWETDGHLFELRTQFYLFTLVRASDNHLLFQSYVFPGNLPYVLYNDV